MNHQKSELYFLLALLIGAFVLAFFIFKPFLYALILAMAFATVFAPLHKKILVITHQYKSLAALLATVSVLIVVVAPLAFLSVQIFQEAATLYLSLIQNGGATALSGIINDAVRTINGFIPLPMEISLDLTQYAQQALSWLLQNFGFLFANAAKIVASIFIFLIALYYMFKDGEKFKAAFIALSPLQDARDESILRKLESAVNSVIRGNLVVALVQGILTAIGFTLFGVPNATLWGSVAAVAALIPGIGTALVLLPAVLYLFLHGAVLPATGLLLWGMTAVGLIDNFLGPKLAERKMQIHPFLILLSILGGISFFGPLGFLLGPLVLSLLVALLEIYTTMYQEHE
ncbi:MAG: AI-2E family transporter [Candidatus Sungbacteria bacterium]|nr:AI-2E family transporter [Candidatus Sungbacteria bacterium]